MKIELPLIEIEEYIKTCYNISIKINFVELNKIEVDYLFKIVISIKEVSDYSILLSYELNWAANMLTKSAKFMSNNSIDKNILQWDTTKKEVRQNLVHIPALIDFLKVFRILNFTLDNNQLQIELTK